MEIVVLLLRREFHTIFCAIKKYPKYSDTFCYKGDNQI